LEKVQKEEEKEKTVAAQRLEKEKEKEENRGAFFLGLLPPHALLRSWSKPAGAHQALHRRRFTAALHRGASPWRWRRPRFTPR
jgi:hypothetical protein